MLLNPRKGQKVQVWYAKKKVGWMTPHHGKIGTVVIPVRSRPRNHIIDIDGELVSVPCGNLRIPKP